MGRSREACRSVQSLPTIDQSQTGRQIGLALNLWRFCLQHSSKFNHNRCQEIHWGLKLMLHIASFHFAHKQSIRCLLTLRIFQPEVVVGPCAALIAGVLPLRIAHEKSHNNEPLSSRTLEWLFEPVLNRSNNNYNCNTTVCSQRFMWPAK